MSDSSSQDNSVPLGLLVSVADLQDEAPAPNSDSDSDSGRDSYDEVDPNELVRLAQRFADCIQDSNPDVDLGEMGLENISEPRHVPPWLVEMIMLHQSGRQSLSVPSVPSGNAESRIEVDSF
jgi:hypothetical protein